MLFWFLLFLFSYIEERHLQCKSNNALDIVLLLAAAALISAGLLYSGQND